MLDIWKMNIFLFTDTHNSLQLDSLKKALRIGNWLSR